MDSKLLAIIIAVAKKEASANKVDITNLQRTVEEQLKEFHKRSPILDTPTFSVVNGSLYCKWDFGPTLNLGNIVGPKGDKGDKGDKGPPGSDGPKGERGYTGDKGLNGSNGSDGAPGRNGKDGTNGKDGLRGAVGPAGEQGAPGGEGTPGKDGKDAVAPPAGADGKDGLDGYDGVGIDKAWVDDKYHLKFNMSSGVVMDAGYVRGPAGLNASKGGRVTGGYSSGGGSSGFSNYQTGISELDFGTGAKTTSVTLTGISKTTSTSVVLVKMRIEDTEDHLAEDLLIDPIRVEIFAIVPGVGFTIYGTMENSTTTGKYKVQWALI
tara:strand:- start:5076 stop:6041 length:966 start_codon:yes stop_codon:yes gene_type:complete